MPAYSLRIGEIAKQQQAPPRESMSRGKIMLNPNVENIPLMMFDIYELTGQRTFIWDFEGNGWSQGYWAGYTELAVMFLYEDIVLRAGQGEAVYTRAGTTTRLAEDGDTDTVAANKAPFDWMEGPLGIERYCYNPDKAGSSLILPLSQNIYRKEGSFSAWICPSAGGGTFYLDDKYVCGNNVFQLFKAAPTADYKFRVRMLDNTTTTVTFSAMSWTAGEWHHIAASWDRSAERLRLWIDGSLEHTNNLLTKRVMEVPDTIGVGCFNDGSGRFPGHVIDFRVWPQELTNEAVDAMWRVGA